MFGVDALLRWRAGTFGERPTMIPDAVGFFVPWILGILSVGMLWRGATGQPYWKRLTLVGVQLLFGLFIYTVAGLAYVLHTGIDTL